VAGERDEDRIARLAVRDDRFEACADAVGRRQEPLILGPERLRHQHDAAIARPSQDRR
jgi:hypothetical protein